MKLRHFTIRDLLWLTALCAVLVAWWIDHKRQSAEIERLTLPSMFKTGKYSTNNMW